MTWQQLLFSPNGRIGARTFWRGVVLLVAAQVVMQVISTVVPTNLALPFSLLSFAYLVLLFWGYLCVYAKRFHDADHSAAWFILALFGSVMCSVLLTLTIFPRVFPEVWAAIQDLVSASRASQEAAAERMAYAIAASGSGLVVWNLVNLAVANLFVGWLVARLPSVRGTNRFGPPEGGDLSVF